MAAYPAISAQVAAEKARKASQRRYDALALARLVEKAAAKGKPVTEDELVRELMARGHAVQVGGRWMDAESVKRDEMIKANRLAMGRATVGAIPSMLEVPGQIAGGAAGLALTKHPAGAVGGRAIGGGAARALGEFARKGVIALNPELGQPEGGDGTSPAASFAQGAGASLVGDALAGTAGRVGLNLLRRSYRPSPTLVSRFADMPDGSIERDRLVKAAEAMNLPPSTKGAMAAREAKKKAVERAKTQRRSMRAQGVAGKVQNIVDREVAAQRKLGVRRPAGWEKEVEKEVLEDMDAILRARTRGTFGVVQETPGTPPSAVLGPSGAPAAPGTPPTIRRREKLLPEELDLLRRGASDVGAPGYAQNQAGQATRSVNTAEAQRLADFAREELYGLPGGPELELMMNDLQEKIGVYRLLRSAGLSPQPAYLRPTGQPVGAPFPPQVAFGIGRGLRTTGTQASAQYGPALLDVLASYFGNLNPDTTELR